MICTCGGVLYWDGPGLELTCSLCDNPVRDMEAHARFASPNESEAAPARTPVRSEYPIPGSPRYRLAAVGTC